MSTHLCVSGSFLLQEKTKAKQKYLKRKKQRRKNKPKAVAGTAASEEEEDASIISDVDPNDDGRIETQAEDKPRKEKRPKKRQKVVDYDDVEMEEPPAGETSVVEPERPVPLRTLPSFPLPALPDAPSKSVLALQGLDQALVGAEIVDSAGLLPIPPEGDDDGGTGLSERTRKRLAELGIVELFAGNLPFHGVVFFVDIFHQCRRVSCHFCFPATTFNGHSTFPSILHATSASPPQLVAAKLLLMLCLSSR